MKLYNAEQEMLAIRTMARSVVDDVSGTLFAALDESHFHHEPARVAFNRLSTIARTRGEVIDFDELVNDPAIDEDMREQLAEYEGRRIKTLTKAERLAQSLGVFRKARCLYALATETLESLQGSSIDIEGLLEKTGDSLLRARAGKDSLTALVKNIGVDANALDAMGATLEAEAPPLYKTGYTEFDERSGGLPTEGVMLLAATTGGGKSTVLMNLLRNMYKLNKISVLNASLEMQEHKLLYRHASMLTGIEQNKFLKKTASEDEKKRARVEWRRLHKFGEQYGIRYGYICPTESITLSQLLMRVKPFGYSVIGIDYVGLLDGMAEDDQWKKLSEAVRQAKIFSTANHCLVIILAQLDDTSNKLRYSKGMLEHADNAWFWNYASQELRDLRKLPIMQEKARDQELYPFELEEAFDKCQINNPDTSVASQMRDDDDGDPLAGSGSNVK